MTPAISAYISLKDRSDKLIKDFSKSKMYPVEQTTKKVYPIGYFCYNRKNIRLENMMSKKLFTDKEIKILSKNPYVKTVSDKAITYTDEFKQIFVIEKDKGCFLKKFLPSVALMWKSLARRELLPLRKGG